MLTNVCAWLADRKSWPAGMAIINGKKVEHVAITGPGKLDGQGLVWWQNRNKDKYDKNRPRTLQIGGTQVLLCPAVHRASA